MCSNRLVIVPSCNCRGGMLRPFSGVVAPKNLNRVHSAVWALYDRVTRRHFTITGLQRRLKETTERAHRSSLEVPPQAYNVFRKAINARLSSGESFNPNSCPVIAPGPMWKPFGT